MWIGSSMSDHLVERKALWEAKVVACQGTVLAALQTRRGAEIATADLYAVVYRENSDPRLRKTLYQVWFELEQRAARDKHSIAVTHDPATGYQVVPILLSCHIRWRDGIVRLGETGEEQDACRLAPKCAEMRNNTINIYRTPFLLSGLATAAASTVPSVTGPSRIAFSVPHTKWSRFPSWRFRRSSKPTNSCRCR
jgi:hypothetical protein